MELTEQDASKREGFGEERLVLLFIDYNRIYAKLLRYEKKEFQKIVSL